jgi:hypothetical protein
MKHVPLIALPDGSHMYESGFIQFMIEDKGKVYHFVSCYRQIEASLLPQEDSISRSFV